VKTWLTGILRHKIIDHLRKRSREKTRGGQARPGEEPFDVKGGWAAVPERWHATPQKLFEEKEFLGALYRCLAEIPPRTARTFVLREMEGLGTDEICRKMKISRSNSWVILYRARMALRRCLETGWFGKKG
jgi:RNA polymerase sigma-70 factor (ECF subfamily)